MSPEAQQNFLQWARSAMWLRREARKGPTVLVANAPSQGVMVNIVEEEGEAVEVAVNWAGVWLGRVLAADSPDFVKSLHAHALASLKDEEAVLTAVSRWLYPQ